jgi:hypothetical protein|tara:strand:+ start:2009 stop:2584 length:576 start_codon:yes stop_codon:yes gene_type:complete
MRPILLDYVASLGHTVFEKGTYNLNIIGIRSRDHQANSFDDRICVVFRDEQGWVTRTWKCTTEPGQYWLENPSNVNGTAILVPGQYRSTWKIDKHQGRYDALCQRKGKVKTYRDSNKDDIIDLDIQSITEGYYGINIHKAGSSSTQVDKWSAGCQVFANADDFEEFMSICYASKEKWGNSFSYTLIEEPEF